MLYTHSFKMSEAGDVAMMGPFCEDNQMTSPLVNFAIRNFRHLKLCVIEHQEKNQAALEACVGMNARMHQYEPAPANRKNHPAILPMHGVTHGSLTNAQRRSDNCLRMHATPAQRLALHGSRMQWQIAISLVHQSLYSSSDTTPEFVHATICGCAGPIQRVRSYYSVDSYTCCDLRF